MSKRSHNIFFHLHTVSGIVISFALFIIFFAGAFTLFLHPGAEWEKGTEHATAGYALQAPDLDRITDSLRARIGTLSGRNIHLQELESDQIEIRLSPSSDSLATGNALKEYNYQLDRNEYKLTEVSGEHSFTIAALLYNLHFYYQLGRPGYYLAGLVSFFFLFAIVSGIIVHWKKAKMNFFVFRPKEKLKTVWTDAHTALGVIGLPFQFLYALTGAMFGLSIILVMSGSMLYDNDVRKLYADLFPRYEQREAGDPGSAVSSYNQLIDEVSGRWTEKRFYFHEIAILNCKTSTEELKVHGEIGPQERFHGDASVVFDVHTGKVLYEDSPALRRYAEKVWPTVYRLHFAEFGEIGTGYHYMLKTVYFLLSVLSCFVIVTGVLIWLEARNKKHIDERRKRYNQRVGKIYLSICLTMLPVTAVSVLVSGLLPADFASRKVFLNCLFFIGWLLLSLIFFLRGDNRFTNKLCLLITAVVGIFIPLLNAFVRNHGLWKSFAAGNTDIFVYDLLWFGISAGCICALYRIRKQPYPKADQR